MPDAGEGAQTDLGLRAAGTAQAGRGSRCAADGCGRLRPLPSQAAWRAHARRRKPQVPAAVRRLSPTETPTSTRQPAAKPLPAPCTRPPCAVLRQHSGPHQCVRPAHAAAGTLATHAVGVGRPSTRTQRAALTAARDIPLTNSQFPIVSRQSQAAPSRPARPLTRARAAPAPARRLRAGRGNPLHGADAGSRWSRRPPARPRRFRRTLRGSRQPLCTVRRGS